jgi:hypothetical protein
MNSPQEDCMCFLFVEGDDDVHVIGQLLKLFCVSTLRNQNNNKKKNINPLKIYVFENTSLDIQPCGGVDSALERFIAKIISIRPRKEVIGLVLDNDKKSNRVAQVKGAIDRVLRETMNRYCWKKLDESYEIMTPGGFIAEPDNTDTPRIGCWLMPDHQSQGMLENFLADLVSNHGLFGYAKHATLKASAEYQAQYKICHENKAIMHTYLAWQDEPGKPFGTAFDQGSFDHSKRLAATFVDWIKRLFRPGDNQEPGP